MDKRWIYDGPSLVTLPQSLAWRGRKESSARYKHQEREGAPGGLDPWEGGEWSNGIKQDPPQRDLVRLILLLEHRSWGCAGCRAPASEESQVGAGGEKEGAQRREAGKCQAPSMPRLCQELEGQSWHLGFADDKSYRLG